MKIVILDDSVDILEYMKAMLEPYHNVYCETNPLSLQLLLAEEEIDVLLADNKIYLVEDYWKSRIPQEVTIHTDSGGEFIFFYDYLNNCKNKALKDIPTVSMSSLNDQRAEMVESGKFISKSIINSLIGKGDIKHAVEYVNQAITEVITAKTSKNGSENTHFVSAHNPEFYFDHTAGSFVFERGDGDTLIFQIENKLQQITLHSLMSQPSYYMTRKEFFTKTNKNQNNHTTFRNQFNNRLQEIGVPIELVYDKGAYQLIIDGKKLQKPKGVVEPKKDGLLELISNLLFPKKKKADLDQAV